MSSPELPGAKHLHCNSFYHHHHGFAGVKKGEGERELEKRAIILLLHPVVLFKESKEIQNGSSFFSLFFILIIIIIQGQWAWAFE